MPTQTVPGFRNLLPVSGLQKLKILGWLEHRQIRQLYKISEISIGCTLFCH